MNRLLLKQTARIVAAQATQQPLTAEQLEVMIGVVHRALTKAAAYAAVQAEVEDEEELALDEPPLPIGRWQPAVPIEQAVTAESVTCLICGKTGKAIRGHLTKTHRIDIATYLAVFGLPKDFPLVAPAYSATRRRLALESGAGENLQAARRKME
ncbi:MAG: MucR family transcriptional regulator [Magnetococcales bacterium]|nr:MucR family transcriptional regulator [Magnetococcales bacterium]